MNKQHEPAPPALLVLQSTQRTTNKIVSAAKGGRCVVRIVRFCFERPSGKVAWFIWPWTHFFN